MLSINNSDKHHVSFADIISGDSVNVITRIIQDIVYSIPFNLNGYYFILYKYYGPYYKITFSGTKCATKIATKCAAKIATNVRFLQRSSKFEPI